MCVCVCVCVSVSYVLKCKSDSLKGRYADYHSFLESLL